MKSLTFLMLLSFTISSSAAAVNLKMGEEHFGNEALEANNFTDWPGIMPIVNDKNRVYHAWVNGDEYCYFSGGTQSLNQALEEFAKVKADKLELVLRPGPGIATTFSPDKKVPFNWNLHLIGGIAAHMAKRDKGSHIWATHPVMTVYVDDQINLSKLQIPVRVNVIEIADLKERYLNCLDSSDQTVRGWSCGELAVLDKYDVKIMHRIAGMLQDDSDWVRLNATGAIATYGNKARSLIAQLESNRDSRDTQLKQRVIKAVESVKAAHSNDQAERAHAQTLQQISEFCKSEK